jgi:hypothetical protein
MRRYDNRRVQRSLTIAHPGLYASIRVSMQSVRQDARDSARIQRQAADRMSLVRGRADPRVPSHRPCLQGQRFSQDRLRRRVVAAVGRVQVRRFIGLQVVRFEAARFQIVGIEVVGFQIFGIEIVRLEILGF